MLVFFKIGFRNLFRNQRRSLLTSAVIGLGVAGLIITDGFLIGMNDNMVSTITTGMISEGQIHHRQFKENLKVENFIDQLPQVIRTLEDDKNIEGFSSRAISFAMVNSPRNMKNISLYGIDPKKESLISNMHKSIIEGEYVKNEKSLVVGQKLLERLEVQLGHKVVVTVAEAESGELAQEMFRISGVYKTGVAELDENMAFVYLPKLQKLLNIQNNVHEIALKFKDRKTGEKKSNPLWQELSLGQNKAESWKQIAASFISLMEMTDISKVIIALVLMILVGLGIVNTLFMALYERIFEFAVLRALGTKAREIIIIIVSEAGALAILSILLGFIITFLFGIPLTLKGVDYGGMEFAEVTLREPIYYVFTWQQIWLYPLGTFLFTVLVSLYPAIYAAKVTMANALKKSL